MYEPMVIQSHKGPYTVRFSGKIAPDVTTLAAAESHFLIDANVARLYKPYLHAALDRPSTIVINAVEANKSLEKTIPVFERLVLSRVRRGHALIAIGGGIVQDITCFIASNLLRGLPWHFVPTTLLAQSDSCIGSKSSINLGTTKNIIGTFNPPNSVHIWTEFLESLEKKDIRSGIGEIIKVHAIEGMGAFDSMASEYSRICEDREVLLRYIRAALIIKKRYIEEDEFDRGIRNVFNYGHSFGHAIESATNYEVPHGIAVTIGMDMANSIAVDRGLLPSEHYRRMHSMLRQNYGDYAATLVPLDAFLAALMRDKKNTSTMLGLIFAVGDTASIKRVDVAPDDAFRSQCARYLAGMGK